MAARTSKILRWLWANFLLASGCLWWAERQLRSEGAVVTLLFHRVLTEPSYRNTHSQPEIIVRERTFRELAAHIAGWHEPVDLQQAKPGIASKKVKIAFTFDDGWKDNYEIAFPIIREYQIPVVIFVATSLVGKSNPFWPEQAIALLRAMRPPIANDEISRVIESLKKCTPEEREQSLASLSNQVRGQDVPFDSSNVDTTLSWVEIEELDRSGARFGSHTQTHQILTAVPQALARNEVLQSKAKLESALGKSCESFSYPNGNWSPETRHIVAEAGFRMATTTEPGAWTATCDPLSIPRINVCEDKVVGPTGRFSQAMFKYMTLWKAWRATTAKAGLGVGPQNYACTTIQQFSK